MANNLVRIAFNVQMEHTMIEPRESAGLHALHLLILTSNKCNA